MWIYPQSWLPYIWALQAEINQYRFKVVIKENEKNLRKGNSEPCKTHIHYFKYVPISQCHWSHIGLPMEKSYTNKKKSLFPIVLCAQSFVGRPLIVFFSRIHSLNKPKTCALAEEKGKNPDYLNHHSFLGGRKGSESPMSYCLTFIDCGARLRQSCMISFI